MRFSTNLGLPPNAHPLTLIDLEETLARLWKDIEEGSLLGFDTETSGLESDGLDVICHYICLSTTSVRAAIPVSGKYEGFMRPVGDFLLKTQEYHVGFNIIYDWNVLYGYTKHRLKWDEPLDFHTCFADGMTLFCRFDEEGEETYGGRGLKDRCRFYLGMPMAEFDWILAVGGVVEAMKQDPVRALDYCTRDGWAHLALGVRGKQIAEQLPWCERCPKCKEYMFEYDSYRRTYICPTHGEQKGEKLTVMDWHRELDVPFLITLHRMERRGMTLDLEYLADAGPKMLQAAASLKKTMMSKVRKAQLENGIEPYSINPNSSAQLQKYLFTEFEGDKKVGLGLPFVKKTKSGAASTDADSLEKALVKYNPPGLQELLSLRDIQKVYKTYIVGLQESLSDFTGRVHGTFRPITKTGRLASRNPNLQNLPARDLKVDVEPELALPSFEELMSAGFSAEEINTRYEEMLRDPLYSPSHIEVSVRRAIAAPKGRLIVDADYAQLEVRLTAIESEDENLINVINDGTDMHCYTAAKAFNSSYDRMYEAKAWDDNDPAPRLAAFHSCLELPEIINPSRNEGRFGYMTSSDRELLKSLAESSLNCSSWDEVSEAIGEDQKDQVLRWLHAGDQELLNLRSSAKSAIFGIIYGIGATGLAVQITKATGEVCDPEFAKELIDSIKFEIFPGIGEMLNRFQRTVQRYGYVRTRMGRYRHPAAAHSGDRMARARARRQSMNSPIQGLAADVVQRAMIAVDRDPLLQELNFQLLLQVHDELVGSAPEEHAQEALDRMIYLMRTAHGMKTAVPLDASGKVADNWGDAH